jgi:hypothetical protein
MSKKTATPTEIIDSLTAKGRETMTAVGNWTGSFFDEGCVTGSGIWGSIFVQEMGQKSSGVINRLRDLGLFEVTPDQEGEAGDWWSLTSLGVDVARALVLATVATPEEAESGDLPAEEPAVAESTVEPEFAADATKEWRGNYNTIFAPAAELIATGSGVEVRTVNVSTMLKETHLAGPTATDVVAALTEAETKAQAALRTWQKTQDRKEQTDMEKFNQNRSFLSGYLGAVARSLTGAKKTPSVEFAKDMEKALRPDAMKAGVAAHKASA